MSTTAPAFSPAPGGTYALLERDGTERFRCTVLRGVPGRSKRAYVEVAVGAEYGSYAGTYKVFADGLTAVSA